MDKAKQPGIHFNGIILVGESFGGIMKYRTIHLWNLW